MSLPQKPREHGQTMTEYAMILAVVVVILVASFKTLGQAITLPLVQMVVALF